MKLIKMGYSRFHPFRSELLEEPNTLNIYYHQMLYYLFNEFKVKEYSHELVSQLVGFVAMDYVRQLIERNETPTDEKTIELLESSTLPATWRFLWWKKKVVKKDFIQCVNQCFTDCDLDLSTLKTAFIDGVCELLPGSRQEQYEVSDVRFASSQTMWKFVVSSDGRPSPRFQLTIESSSSRRKS